MVYYVHPKQEKRQKPSKHWPKGTRKGPLVTVQVRETEPSPTLASDATIAEFRCVRRTKAWWKRHIEEILRIEAWVIQEGYMDLSEYVKDLHVKLNDERKQKLPRCLTAGS